MEGMCVGCEQTKYVIDYVYIPDPEVVERRGQYCSECMCCSFCGEVLPPDRLAYMESVYIPRKKNKGGNKMRMSIPARWCAVCIRNCPDDPILESEKVQAEEWDVQP